MVQIRFNKSHVVCVFPHGEYVATSFKIATKQNLNRKMDHLHFTRNEEHPIPKRGKGKKRIWTKADTNKRLC